MSDFKLLTRKEREDVLKNLNQPDFREKQIFSWQCRRVTSFDDMTDLPANLREELKSRYSFEGLKVLREQSSSDGTKKFLLGLEDGEAVETVFMRYEYGNSLCISSQVGCNMGCRFCASTIGGRRRNLSAEEMLEEVLSSERAAGAEINHIVLMGIGEPFDNYDNLSAFLKYIHDPKGKNLSYRNITVSTCGLVPKINRFAEDYPQVNLAVSLHAASQDEREKIMPVAKSYRMDELMAACREYTEKTSRRITFEYALIESQNDREEDARNLAKLLRGMLCHVNLIPLNPVAETGMKGSSDEAARAFAAKLESFGIPATVRRRLGRDIDAACGQLRRKNESGQFRQGM